LPQTRCDCGRKLARERGLYATYVSNGYMTLEALRMLREAGLDGLKVDVKGGIEEYRRFNSTLAEVVWRNAREAKRTGIHVEVVYPVVTGATDSENLVHETVEQHLKELGPECSILDRVDMHPRKHDVHVWAAVQEPELAPRTLLQAAHLLFFRSRSRLAQQLSAPANPAALHPLQFVYEGRAYPVYAMPAELTGPREVAKPIPFSKVAAERGMDVVELMELYTRYIPWLHLIRKFVKGEPLTESEKQEVRSLMEDRASFTPVAYLLSQT